MKQWRLLRPNVLKRTSVYEAGKPSIEWVVDPNYAPFPSRKAAVRHYLESVEPDLKKASDTQLEAHWKTPLYRNIVRVAKRIPLPDAKKA